MTIAFWEEKINSLITIKCQIGSGHFELEILLYECGTFEN